MPVLGLVNHGVKGYHFDTKSGISIDGIFEDEVLAHYGAVDPYGAFSAWGFASNEPAAYSLPLTMKWTSRKLVIQRQIDNKQVRGEFRVPVLETSDDKVTISHLMLGYEGYPRLAKGTFY